jgi:hypothetical protein
MKDEIHLHDIVALLEDTPDPAALKAVPPKPETEGAAA